MDEIAARAPKLSPVSLADALVHFDARTRGPNAQLPCRSPRQAHGVLRRRGSPSRLATHLAAASKAPPRRRGERVAAVLLPL